MRLDIPTYYWTKATLRTVNSKREPITLESPRFAVPGGADPNNYMPPMSEWKIKEDETEWGL